MGGITKLISGLLGGGDDQSAAMDRASAKAAETARATEAARAAASKAQQDMQANFQTDLSGEGKATVVAGGSADALGAATDSTKRKRGVAGLASTLGLNV